MEKLIRITTVPISLEKLLEGQLAFMSDYYKITAVSAEKERLEKYGRENAVDTFYVELTREITPIKDLKAVYKLYRFFRKERPKIVHTHTPKAGIVGIFAAWLARVPVRLHTVAGLPLMETTGFKRKILDFVEKATYFFATQVYPNSQGLNEIILQENFAKPAKLKVLGKGSSNGIDTRYFNPEIYSEEFKCNFRKELGISRHNMVFIFVGRLVSEKGINELVYAFEKLYEENKKTSLLLVGPYEQALDPLKAEVLDFIKNHPAIISVGYQQDVRPYLAIADILTFPSYREGFPNVVMQAGAMKLGSIVTDINGCNEIISDGVNGLIIAPKDQEALFFKMQLLMEDPNLCSKLKANSRDVITSNYERIEFWQLLLKEYREQERLNEE